MKKDMTCIMCPIGCQMTIEGSEGNYTVTGNSCKNGEKYAIEEMTAPKRIIPTTVVVKDALIARCPVKTAEPVPKEKIFEIMDVINKVVLEAPVHVGDVVVKDILGTGVDVVATKTMPRVD